MFSQPGGAEVWKEIGGWLALTEAEVAGVMTVHTLVAVNSDKPPKAPQAPVGRIGERARKNDLQSRFERGAEAFAAKFNSPEMRAKMEARLAAWPKNWREGTAGPALNARNAERLATWKPPPDPAP